MVSLCKFTRCHADLSLGYLLVHDGARHLAHLAEAELRGVQKHRLAAQTDLDVEGDNIPSSSSISSTSISSTSSPGAGVVGPP
ncbi:hypothetical protein JOQ06_028613 [Pogonophryne albipinna]|uniref:Uncharacterized protein n=1 Tax=Pogonophryne albipinna TaxID=1090488 RepID=A0AAD6B987_9TELE|nr:hypothetical protein JOQ06_028613 [Pogonophryne albipinna]